MDYLHLLKTAPYELWRVAHKMDHASAAALLPVLRAHASIQARFLAVAAGAEDAPFDQAAYQRLVQAGKALSKINTFAYAPQSRDAAERIRPLSAQPEVVRSAQAALRARGSAEIGLDELLVVLWLVTLLAQEGSPASLAVLAEIGRAAAQNTASGESHSDVLAKIIGYYVADHPGLEEIAHTLGAAIQARQQISPAAQVLTAAGITPPSPKWRARLVVTDRPGEDPVPWSNQPPYADLRLQGDKSPHYELRLRDPAGESAYFNDDSLPDHEYPFGLKPPQDLGAVREYLDALGEKLNLRWAWERAYVDTNLRGKNKNILSEWFRNWQKE